MFHVLTPFLWVGYGLLSCEFGWARFNIILSMSSGWVRVEICGYGFNVG